jgi:hypothetical protein
VALILSICVHSVNLSYLLIGQRNLIYGYACTYHLYSDFCHTQAQEFTTLA